MADAGAADDASQDLFPSAQGPSQGAEDTTLGEPAGDEAATSWLYEDVTPQGPADVEAKSEGLSIQVVNSEATAEGPSLQVVNSEATAEVEVADVSPLQPKDLGDPTQAIAEDEGPPSQALTSELAPEMAGVCPPQRQDLGDPTQEMAEDEGPTLQAVTSEANAEDFSAGGQTMAENEGPSVQVVNSEAIAEDSGDSVKAMVENEGPNVQVVNSEATAEDPGDPVQAMVESEGPSLQVVNSEATAEDLDTPGQAMMQDEGPSRQAVNSEAAAEGPSVQAVNREATPEGDSALEAKQESDAALETKMEDDAIPEVKPAEEADLRTGDPVKEEPLVVPKPEPVQVKLEDDWIDAAAIDWSSLTPAETERLRKQIRRQEKRRKRGQEDRGEGGRRAAKERKREKRPSTSGEGADGAAEAESGVPEAPAFDVFNSGLPLAENFRTVLATLKVAKPPQIPVPQLEEKSNRLIEKMYDAYRQDQLAMDEGQPGVMKLRLLDEVTSAMSKSYLLEHLVRRYDRGMSVLDCFADWLEPVRVPGNPKRQLPNLNIRTRLLAILAKLPLQNDLGKVQKRDDLSWDGVGREDLEATRIGHRVSWLANHPLETAANRHTAEGIVQRWSRLLFNNTRDYKRLAEADAERGRAPDTLVNLEWQDPLQTLPPETIYSTDPNAELEARRERYQRRIRLPQKQIMNFHYRPKSALTPEMIERREKLQSGKERLQTMVKRHAQGLKAANKIGGRSRGMSIEGSLSTLPQGAT